MACETYLGFDALLVIVPHPLVALGGIGDPLVRESVHGRSTKEVTDLSRGQSGCEGLQGTGCDSSSLSAAGTCALGRRLSACSLWEQRPMSPAGWSWLRTAEAARNQSAWGWRTEEDWVCLTPLSLDASPLEHEEQKGVGGGSPSPGSPFSQVTPHSKRGSRLPW